MHTFDDFTIERIFKGPGLAETLYLGTCRGQRVLRKAANHDIRDFSRIALLREIAFLRSLPEEIAPHYIHLIRSNVPSGENEFSCTVDSIFYDMPYLDPDDGWLSLAACLISGSLSRPEAEQVLGEIVDTAFLTFTADTREPSENYLENTMIHAMRDSIAWAENEGCFLKGMGEKKLLCNGVPVMEYCDMVFLLSERFHEFEKHLIPQKDRLVHGDFFPENIMYNTNSGEWLLLDPVGVRGVFRGDFLLDVVKMGEWLSGELPALRYGQFECHFSGDTVSVEIMQAEGKLARLADYCLDGWYRERLQEALYQTVYSVEKNCDIRAEFIRAFYALSILPLVEENQAVARYILAARALENVMEMTGLEG